MDDDIGQMRFNSFKAAAQAKGDFLSLSSSRQWLAVCTLNPQQATLPWIWALHTLLREISSDSGELLEFCDRLRWFGLHFDWDQALLMPEDVGDLLRGVCNLPDSVRPLKNIILDIIMTTFDEKVSDGLSLIHVLRLKQMPSYFMRISVRFPPKQSDLQLYFSSLTSKLVDKGQFSEASIYAAIALSLQSSSVQAYRIASLSSLAAHASPSIAPLKDRNAQSGKKSCALVTKFSSYFRDLSISSLAEIHNFAKNNEQRFHELGLWKLVKASMVRARIEYIHKVLRYTKIGWFDLVKTGPESLDDLLVYGLRCKIYQRGNEIILSESPSEDLFILLERVTAAANALSGMKSFPPQGAKDPEPDEDSDGKWGS